MNELEAYRKRGANLALARKLKIAVWIVTALVLFLVGLMRRVKIDLPEGVSLHLLPPLHALLNSGAAAALVLALLCIRKGRVLQHQRWIYVAMGCSILFLLSYVTYHFTTTETIYGDLDGNKELSEEERAEAGPLRAVYLSILLSHIALAAVSLPFILLSFVYGFTNQTAKHRRIATRVFPVWLYVAVTGPVVYLMLRPYY